MRVHPPFTPAPGSVLICTRACFHAPCTFLAWFGFGILSSFACADFLRFQGSGSEQEAPSGFGIYYVLNLRGRRAAVDVEEQHL